MTSGLLSRSATSALGIFGATCFWLTNLLLLYKRLLVAFWQMIQRWWEVAKLVPMYLHVIAITSKHCFELKLQKNMNKIPKQQFKTRFSQDDQKSKRHIFLQEQYSVFNNCNYVEKEVRENIKICVMLKKKIKLLCIFALKYKQHALVTPTHIFIFSVKP